MRTLYRRILLFLYPYFLLTEVLTDLLIYYFSININPTPACSSVTDYLGKVIAETVLTSDNATISVPAGIVAVAVDGEEAVKAIVK